MRELKHFIGNQFVPGGSSFSESINPFKPSEVLGKVPGGGAEQVDAAVCHALVEGPNWRSATGAVRSQKLHTWADVIQSRSEELANAIVAEVGKPIGEAKGEVGRCVAILRYFAGESVRKHGDVIPSLTPNALQFTIHEPLGIVGLITPWNFPMAIPLWKAAPALAVGNSVILKPSEHSGFCAELLAETAQAAGIGSAFQVVQGSAEAGKALAEHGDVAAISFTGSDKTGKAISLACAERNKKFQTEMGGKNVAIVLPDADLKKAAALVAGGAMRFAGQKCTATSRVVVDRSIRSLFIDELRSAIQDLPIGDPMAESTAIGPVITAESQRRIDEAIGGTEALYQGDRPTDGFFVAPTVVGGVAETHGLAQNELFGPVLTLLEAESVEEAIQIANGTRFGLSASLCTQDLGSALKYIQQVQAGMVRVNADTTGVDPHAPFGGFKGSSSGTREQGEVAKDFYTQIKTVQINP